MVVSLVEAFMLEMPRWRSTSPNPLRGFNLTDRTFYQYSRTLCRNQEKHGKNVFREGGEKE